MSGIFGPGPSPRSFDKAMVFVDGTNLLNRLREGRMRCKSLRAICNGMVGGRQLVRVYFYTTAEKHAKAIELHGKSFLEGCRVVHGDTVTVADGRSREKGVDALLVADLIYHAAQKNCSYAVVISNDSDFAHALERVEDFGCNTGLVAIGCEAVERLRGACDDYTFLNYDRLVARNWTEIVTIQDTPIV